MFIKIKTCFLFFLTANGLEKERSVVIGKLKKIINALLRPVALQSHLFNP